MEFTVTLNVSQFASLMGMLEHDDRVEILSALAFAGTPTNVGAGNGRAIVESVSQDTTWDDLKRAARERGATAEACDHVLEQMGVEELGDDVDWQLLKKLNKGDLNLVKEYCAGAFSAQDRQQITALGL